MTQSMWEYGENVIVTGGLSKAFVVLGLRIGWVAAHDPNTITELWSYTDYTSIAPSILSDILATVVLRPNVRARILARTQNNLKTNWRVVNEWLDKNAGLLHCNAPKDTAVCLIRYERDLDSVTLAERLIREKSVLCRTPRPFSHPSCL